MVLLQRSGTAGRGVTRGVTTAGRGVTREVTTVGRGVTRGVTTAGRGVTTGRLVVVVAFVVVLLVAGVGNFRTVGSETITAILINDLITKHIGQWPEPACSYNDRV